jgi:hypothetical protein
MTDSNLIANAVVAQSNSQYISIVAENGEQFNPNQKIIFNIEAEVGFVSQDSYLIFDVLNNSADKGRYCLQKNLGAHALIDRVDIFSKETGILLESNTHYATWANIENQYLFDDTTNLSNHQGVGKPVQSWKHQVAADGTASTVRSVPNPRFIENNQLSPVAALTTNGGAACYTTRRFCIPLKVGLFGAYDDTNTNAIPVLAFGGLRIEITLAKPKIALQPLGYNYKDIAHQSKNADVEGDWVEGLALTDAPADMDTTTFTAVKTLTTAQGWRTNHLQDLGLVVGNKVKVNGKVNATKYGKNADDDFQITGTIATIVPSTAQDILINGKTHSVSKTITITFTAAAVVNIDGYKDAIMKRVLDDCNYKVMNTEFRLLQVVAPPNIADSIVKGGLNYQFNSYEVFFSNIPTGSLRHQIPINSVASKALALFTMLYDSSNAEGESYSSADMYNGALPSHINLNDIVYFINNRLYPLRSYNPQNKADKVLAQNELVKALKAIGKLPMNLGNADFADLEGYTNTPLVCRELARKGMVFDLRNAEPELRLAFSAARSQILRANTFVFSKKIVQTTANGVQVIH